MDTEASLMPTKTTRLIDAILLRSGHSQAELARRAGIPRSVLNAYLRGHRQPGVDALVRLCAAGGFELRLTPHSAPVNPKRAGRLLTQVLELAEALPFRRSEKLEYPRLAGLVKPQAGQ